MTLQLYYIWYFFLKVLSYTLFQSLKWQRTINFYVVIFLRKRNVGLGFWKLKLVFLYYKVQIAVLRSVPKNDSMQIFKLLTSEDCLLCYIAITQHSSPLRSEGASSMCFRECSAVQTDCLSEPLPLQCLSGSRMAEGPPQPESQESELSPWLCH